MLSSDEAPPPLLLQLLRLRLFVPAPPLDDFHHSSIDRLISISDLEGESSLVSAWRGVAWRGGVSCLVLVDGEREKEAIPSPAVVPSHDLPLLPLLVPVPRQSRHSGPWKLLAGRVG